VKRFAAWLGIVLVLASVSALLAPLRARAELPSWLRTENGHVEDGNALLAKGDAKGALAEYDKAARQLPDDPGVQLNRGLALLKMGELPKAREALVSAGSAAAQPSVRADAYQNLALAFYRDGDALATQNKHGEAQKMFQEAVDAAKRSLRLRPADPSTAWNLELASRRLREEKAKKQAEDEKKQQDEKKDDQKQDQNGQGQDSQDPDDQQDQQKQDPADPKQDDAQKDQKQNDPQKQAEDEKKKQEEQKKQQEQAQKNAEQQKKDAEQKKRDAAQGQEPKDEGEQKPIPADVKQALDSLKDSEQNFERVRARQRAMQENRAPEKDW
jgi:Flp pilus assembly protein TadD